MTIFGYCNCFWQSQITDSGIVIFDIKPTLISSQHHTIPHQPSPTDVVALFETKIPFEQMGRYPERQIDAQTSWRN